MIAERAMIGLNFRSGTGSVVWHFANVEDDVTLGDFAIIGSHAFVGRGTTVGAGSRIQSGAFICRNAVIGSGVFVGPHAVLTDDKNPRAGNAAYRAEPPVLKDGCSIGAGAVVLPGVTVGRDAMVGAGAVVVRDVPDGGTVMGVPARE